MELVVGLRKNDEFFDVTKGAYDGAQVCEIVGLNLLKKIPRFSGSSKCRRPNLDESVQSCTNASNMKI